MIATYQRRADGKEQTHHPERILRFCFLTVFMGCISSSGGGGGGGGGGAYSAVPPPVASKTGAPQTQVCVF